MGEITIRQPHLESDALLTRRTKLGVSQEEFADLCDLDRTYVGGIERGERNVSLVNFEKLAEALNISLSELFFFSLCIQWLPAIALSLFRT
jgi:transcriptional regulator with XRE-family HTH domain